MTKPRAAISASLAERGLEEWWANEAEAANRCGMTPETFKLRLPELERLGFPKVQPMNGKWFIPDIRAFWTRQQAATQLQRPQTSFEDTERQKENWSHEGPRTRQRLAS